MKKNGFTLVELLLSLALLGIILFIGLCASRKTMATSLSWLRAVGDNEVFMAAKEYALSDKEEFNNHGYICVSVNDLIKYDYLRDTNDDGLKSKFVAVYGDNVTKIIGVIKYVERCN